MKNRKVTKKILGIALTLAVSLGLVVIGFGQAQGAAPEISWYTVDGGGTFSSGGDFSLAGTAAQPDAGTHTGGDFSLQGGFWSGPIVSGVTTTGTGGGAGDAAELPDTGFAPGRVTQLGAQPAAKAYSDLGELWLEIPSLDVQISIVGVPLVDDTWDVSWLNETAGYLEGTAFPTWVGNTVLTAHVWDAWNRPGPFRHLRDLGYGDRFYIHDFGQVYTYEVRTTQRVNPNNLSILKHSEYDILTLVTCEKYNLWKGEYRYRRAVSAVLLKVR